MVFGKYKKDRQKRKSEKTNTERTTPAVRFPFVCFSHVSLSVCLPLTSLSCLSFFGCWCIPFPKLIHRDALTSTLSIYYMRILCARFSRR